MNISSQLSWRYNFFFFKMEKRISITSALSNAAAINNKTLVSIKMAIMDCFTALQFYCCIVYYYFLKGVNKKFFNLLFQCLSSASGTPLCLSTLSTVVPERKFAKIQSIVFYGLDGYFWTLITTSNTKNPNLNSKTSFF